MKNILFLNHKQKQCGVYQYGLRSANILKKSSKYNFIYCEVEQEKEFSDLISLHEPHGVIYNYHPSTMGWVNNQILNKHTNVFHFGLHHEGNEIMNVWFDYYLITDSTFKDIHNKYSIPRPLFEDCKIHYETDSNAPIKIGSFGFGFENKGFQKIVQLADSQLDENVFAEINLHIPFAYYGDDKGVEAKRISKLCRSFIKKPNIKLNITHDFLTDEQVLKFLATNDINCFLYDEMPGRGLSSVIDYALSAGKPIAVTETYMFRHLSDIMPSICVEKNSLMYLLSNHPDSLKPYREKWSNYNFISKYEQIIAKTEKLI